MKCQRFWKWHAGGKNAWPLGRGRKERVLFIIMGFGVYTSMDEFFFFLELFSARVTWHYCPPGTNNRNEGLITSARSRCPVAVPGWN